MTSAANAIIITSITQLKQIRSIVGEVDNMLHNKKVLENLGDIDLSSNKFSEQSSLIQTLAKYLRNQQLSIVYPNLLWSSLFLTSYSTLESTLDMLSDYYAKEKNIDIQPKELKDSGIKRSEKYLSKLVKIKFPAKKDNWKSINDVSCIRHCIVHANGNIHQSNKPETIHEVVKKYDQLKIRYDHIVITKEFVLLFIDWCEMFFQQLMQSN
jgi:hypothetical protein